MLNLYEIMDCVQKYDVDHFQKDMWECIEVHHYMGRREVIFSHKPTNMTVKVIMTKLSYDKLLERI